MTSSRRIPVLILLAILIISGSSSTADEPRRDAHGDPLPSGALSRLGTLRWRTGSNVALTAFLDGGKELLTVNQEQMAQVWDLTTGQEKRRFAVDQGMARTNARPAAAGVALALLSPLGGGIAASGDGTILAVAAASGEVSLWDTKTGKIKGTFSGGTTARGRMALSHDGQRLALLGTGYAVTIWDTTSRRKMETLGGGDASGLTTSYRLAFSGDGKTLIHAGLERSPKAALSPVVTFLEVGTGRAPRRFTELAGTNTTSVYYSALSRDGRTLALPDRGKIHLLDLNEGKITRVIPLPANELATNLVFTPDGIELLSVKVPMGASASISGWEAATGKPTRGSKEVAVAPVGVVGVVSISRALGSSLTISADGKLLAWGDQGVVRVMDLATGKERISHPGHSTPVQQITFLPDGKSVVTRGTDGLMQRWESDSGRHLETLPANQRLVNCLSPDGRLRAVGEADGRIRVLEVATGRERYTIKGEGVAAIRTVVFSPDSRLLALMAPAVGGGEQVVQLYEVSTGKLSSVVRIPTAAPQVALGVIRLPVRRLLFSPDGRFLLTDSQPPIVWETATGREYRQLVLDDDMLRHAVFTPDGRAVAIETVRGNLALWELATGKKRLALAEAPTLAGDDKTPQTAVNSLLRTIDSRDPHSVAISPDGRLVAQAADQGKTTIWDLLTGKKMAVLEGHSGSLTAAAFSPDGRRLATGGADTTTLIWDATPWRPASRRPADTLSREKLDGLWNALADADAARAYEAIRTLASVPAQGIGLLRERLQAARAPDAARLKKLVANLDSDEFTAREEARLDLEKLGDLAGPALREALASARSAEVRRQIESLLSALNSRGLAGEQMRVLRAMEVLELVRSAEAIQIVEKLAAGAPGAMATAQAEAVLKRLRGM